MEVENNINKALQQQKKEMNPRGIYMIYEKRTSQGFRRIMINCSARCIKKLVNFRHNRTSISSCCLILIDTRTELMDDSIKHRSFSVRATITEFKSNSLLPLKQVDERSIKENEFPSKKGLTSFRLRACYVARQFEKENFVNMLRQPKFFEQHQDKVLRH